MTDHYILIQVNIDLRDQNKLTRGSLPTLQSRGTTESLPWSDRVQVTPTHKTYYIILFTLQPCTQ